MKACLSDTVTEIKDVEAAVELLEKKDAHDVLDGLGKLGSALEQLPTAVEMCEAAAKDVKDEAPKLLKALEALKHPKEFAFHVGKDLIVNHADIFHEVSASIDDYRAQKWEDFGKDTGAALSKLLVGTNEMSLAWWPWHRDDQWSVLLKGVLEGFGLTKDLDKMKDCLANTESEIKDVEAAIQLLEKKDAHDVLDGLAKLGSALELLPTAVQNCDAAAKDVKVNHADIFRDVSASIDDYHAQKWENCGKDTGAALSKLLVGETVLLQSPSSTCSLYEIADDTCNQSDIDCKYSPYARKFQKGLQDGTCAEHGYSVKSGTKTMHVPVIGDIVVTMYTKEAASLIV